MGRAYRRIMRRCAVSRNTGTEPAAVHVPVAELVVGYRVGDHRKSNDNSPSITKIGLSGGRVAFTRNLGAFVGRSIPVNPEGQQLLSSFLGLFSKRFRRPALVPLTLGMLAEAARRGRWDTAEIEASAIRDS